MLEGVASSRGQWNRPGRGGGCRAGGERARRTRRRKVKQGVELCSALEREGEGEEEEGAWQEEDKFQKEVDVDA